MLNAWWAPCGRPWARHGRNVSRSEGFTDARRELRLVDHGGNGPADQVPPVGEPEGNHRLNVENVLHVVVRPHPEVDLVLERHGNEIRNGILRLLGQVDVVLSPHRSRQHQQQEQRGAHRPAPTGRYPPGDREEQCPEQTLNDPQPEVKRLHEQGRLVAHRHLRV